MKGFFGHLKTVLKHKTIVCGFCFKCGLYRQGLTHDLSKLSPAEFIPGVRYFSGKRSPNEQERTEKGYSAAWLHHKGRNLSRLLVVHYIFHISFYLFSCVKFGLKSPKDSLRKISL